MAKVFKIQYEGVCIENPLDAKGMMNTFTPESTFGGIAKYKFTKEPFVNHPILNDYYLRTSAAEGFVQAHGHIVETIRFDRIVTDNTKTKISEELRLIASYQNLIDTVSEYNRTAVTGRFVENEAKELANLDEMNYSMNASERVVCPGKYEVVTQRYDDTRCKIVKTPQFLPIYGERELYQFFRDNGYHDIYPSEIFANLVYQNCRRYRITFLYKLNKYCAVYVTDKAHLMPIKGMRKIYDGECYLRLECQSSPFDLKFNGGRDEYGSYISRINTAIIQDKKDSTDGHVVRFDLDTALVIGPKEV